MIFLNFNMDGSSNYGLPFFLQTEKLSWNGFPGFRGSPTRSIACGNPLRVPFQSGLMPFAIGTLQKTFFTRTADFSYASILN
ncbi:MAG: hypothetical protein II077_15525, partial [Treponema sp.]|nr:hypothetical protein [Treponema sp.]